MGASVSRDEYTEVVYVKGGDWCIGLSMHEGANFDENFRDLLGRLKQRDEITVSGDQPYTPEAEGRIKELLKEAQGLPVHLKVRICMDNGAELLNFLWDRLGKGNTPEMEVLVEK